MTKILYSYQFFFWCRKSNVQKAHKYLNGGWTAFCKDCIDWVEECLHLVFIRLKIELFLFYSCKFLLFYSFLHTNDQKLLHIHLWWIGVGFLFFPRIFLKIYPFPPPIWSWIIGGIFVVFINKGMFVESDRTDCKGLNVQVGHRACEQFFYFLHFYFSSNNFYWPLCNPKQQRVQVEHRAHIPQWLECDKELALLEPEHMTVVARLGSNFHHSRRHGTWIASLCSEK